MRISAPVVLTGALAAMVAAFLAPLETQAQAPAKAPAKAAPKSNYKAPRTKDGKPDLNGIWMSSGLANWDLEPHASGPSVEPKLGATYALPPSVGFIVDNGGKIPYKPEALEKKKANFAVRAKEDPEAKCYMGGIPRSNYMPYPFQIIQGQQNVMFAYQHAGAVRIVNMGKAVKAPADSWMGNNNGRWEGDTLVIEVDSLADGAWLTRSGDQHSDKFKVTEQWTPYSQDVLMYEARIEDPETYTQPWTIRVPMYRQLEQGAKLLEFKCVVYAEELLYGHLRKPADAPTVVPNDAKGKGKGKGKQ